MSLLLLLGGSSAPAFLSDNFDDNIRDTAKWNLGSALVGNTAGSANTLVEEVGGRLKITLPASLAGYNYRGYKSVNTYSMVGGASYVAIPAIPNQSQSTEIAHVIAPASTTIPRFLVTIFSNTVRVYAVTGDNPGTFTQLGANITYNATNHRWLRLRFNASTAFLDAAPSTASNPPADAEWVLGITSGTLPANADLSAMHLLLEAGTYSSSPSPGFGEFDGFNTSTVGPVNTAFAPDSMAQTQSLGSPSIAAKSTITPDNLTQAQTLSSPSIAAKSTITVDGLAQTQALSSPAVSAKSTIAVDGLSQSQSLSSPTIATKSTVVPDSLAQTQSLGSPTVAAKSVLVSDNLVQAQSTTSPTSSSAAIIAPDNLSQTQSTTSPTFSVRYAFAPASLNQAQVTSSPTVAYTGTGGRVGVWLGSWQQKPVKVWTGSAWVEKPVKVWSGSAWVAA